MIYRADNWIYRDSIAAYWRMTGRVDKVEYSVHRPSSLFHCALCGCTAWGAFRPPPMTPRMALKIAAARSAPLRLHLAERADSTSLSRPPSGRRPGGQSWMRACVLANFPDAPNPRLLLLSLSCGACLAERKDVPCGTKKGPRGRRATSTTQRLKNTFLQRVIPVEALRQPRRQTAGQQRIARLALGLDRRARRRFHRMDLMADQPRGGRPAILLTKQQMAILQ